MTNQETTTPIWSALRFMPNVFGTFDAFVSEEDRQAYLDGPTAKALMADAAKLLASPPEIVSIEVFGLKSTGAA